MLKNEINVKIFGETVRSSACEEGTGKGVQFIVNGWTISAQAGFGNYCSQDPSRNTITLDAYTIRTNCEIALIGQDGKLIKLGGDSILGWVKWASVLEIVYWLASLDYRPVEGEVRNFVLKTTKEGE